jgi:hypothetical protein
MYSNGRPLEEEDVKGEIVVMYFSHFWGLQVYVTKSSFRNFINSHNIKVPLY